MREPVEEKLKLAVPVVLAVARLTPSIIGTASPFTSSRCRSNAIANTLPLTAYTIWPVGTYRASLPPSMSVFRSPDFNACTTMCALSHLSGPVPVASVNINDPGFPGGALTIQITADISTGGTVKSDPDGGSCAVPCVRTSASAQSASPIAGDITYKITHNGVTLADLIVHVALGSLLAQTTYKAAPGAG